jgi:hypothetical protein
LDSEFLALSVIFIFLGITGIILFTGPKTPVGDSCYCPIPSPEPGAMQATSGILLVFGGIFLPIGILKGGPPSFGRRAVPMSTAPGVVVPAAPRYTPLPLTSGKLYTLGILGVIVGGDFIEIPGFLIFDSRILTLVGVIIAGAGAVATYIGSKTKK